MRRRHQIAVAVLGLVAACNESKSSSTAQSTRADCDKVAEILANFELGPAGKPEARPPIIAKHKQACLDHNLTAVEATCMATVSSTWELIDCAPRMFPQRSTAADCKPVAVRMRQGVRAEMPKEIGTAHHAMLDAMMAAMETACLEDNWPDDYRKCVLAAKPDDHVAFTACDLPSKLEVQLGERLKPIVRAP